MSEQSKIGNFFKKVSQKVYDLQQQVAIEKHNEMEERSVELERLREEEEKKITLTFNALGAQLADLDYHEDYQASDSESSQDYQDDHDAGSDSE